MNTPDSKEIEAALVLTSEDPGELLKTISGIRSIDKYSLLDKGVQNIRDVYFDTVKGDLQSAMLALRVREINSKYWLTFKGLGHATNSGGVVRYEMEKEWSLDAFSRVMSDLAERGIKVREPEHKPETDNPVDVLSSAGFKVVQERNTRRKVRNVVLSGDRIHDVLAELAIDSVVYRFGGREIRLYEVEVELKGKGDRPVLNELVQGIKLMCGPELRDWPHSKLATGKAIEQLSECGDSQGMIDENGNLKREAYKKIDGFLEF